VQAPRHELTPEDVRISMYGAADAVGTKANPEDLTKLIMHVLKKNRTGEP